MYLARDNKGHWKVCLTLIFKVNFRIQVTNVSHVEIINIGYVQIDTKNESVSRYTTHDQQKVTITNFDLDFQGHPLRSSKKL